MSSNKISSKDILECQTFKWHPIFKHLTYKILVIDLPDSFVSYLIEDGVYVENDSKMVLYFS